MQRYADNVLHRHCTGTLHLLNVRLATETGRLRPSSGPPPPSLRASPALAARSSCPPSALPLRPAPVAGIAGWSQLNTPLMDERPETSVFFILVMVSTTLAALNLFLGAIVERATEARAISVREELAKKDQGAGGICSALGGGKHLNGGRAGGQT